MTAGSYCYIGPQGIVHGTMVGFRELSFKMYLFYHYLIPVSLAKGKKNMYLFSK